MNISIVNESFLSNKQIEQLKEIGGVSVINSSNIDILNDLKDTEVLVTDMFMLDLDDKLFSTLPNLKYVTINSTGFDRIDISSARKNDVKVSNVPEFGTDSVAELAIALMFSVLRNIPQFDNEMRRNPTELDPTNEKTYERMGFNIRGKVLGVIGLGAIGTRVSEIGQGLGMKVIAYNRSERTVEGVTNVSLDELLKKSDIVSLNVPLTDETKHLISNDELSKMKETSILVNTARGGVIDERALVKALKEKKILGAGLDIIENYSKDNELLKMDNVVLTPHTGWLTKEAKDNIGKIMVKNVVSFVNGKPINIVN